ncbi:MAG: FHA domain-containing protein [Patescibacteria group bacterium]
MIKAKKRPKASLTIQNTCFKGFRIQIKKKRITLGRHINNDICLDDPDVALFQAEISWHDGQYFLENVDGRAPSLVSGQAVKNTRLKSGCLIKIGRFVLKFSLDN